MVVIDALEKAVAVKQRRADKLEAWMNERHLDPDDCKLYDDLARKFNAADVDDKMRIAAQLVKVSKRLESQGNAAKHQNDNYIKWMEEQHRLLAEIGELSNEVATKKFYARAIKEHQ